ncbi:apolipoprotein N-acyltransferase [Synechococcus sp. Nb3U1]|uniref:apolipoprotein N-acyltransferase n=1 Tax=Synechococcus sp. Nb3U1 TaxID=1914529 RepID=UPI001F3E7192|nr:apolipoprotein N-acyltransferase [Synechococcus sp. Nb3U1]
MTILLLCLGSPNRWLHWFPGALLGLAPLFYLCEQRQGWRRLGLAYSLWFCVCLYAFWVDPFSVKVLSAWEILGGFVVAPLIPLFFTTATLLSLYLSRPLPAWVRPLGIATVWTGLDGLLGLLWSPIPFHWGSLLFDWPLGIQMADVTGIWGVTFFAVFVNGLLWQVATQGWQIWKNQLSDRSTLWRTLALGLGLSGAVLAYGGWRLAYFDNWAAGAGAPRFRVGAVQQVAWLEADRSWEYRIERYRELHQLSRQAVAKGAELVIWPEGALRARLLNTGLEPYVLEPMQGILLPTGALITGATEPDPRTVDLPDDQMQFFNTALLFDAQGNLLDLFGKQWIFPYFESGRYVPSPDGYRPLAGGERFGALGVMVCLESVLPAPSRTLTRNGAESLIVISDDSWFGNSHWPMLHGKLSVFRAIENRRSVVFVNNTGGNLVVDPSGRLQQVGPIFQRGVITGEVMRRSEQTFFSRSGDWMAWLTLALSFGLLRWRWGSRARRG